MAGALAALLLLGAACGADRVPSTASTTTTADRAVAAAPPCPHAPVTSPSSRSAPVWPRHSVPPGATAVTVCRYGGLGSPTGVDGAPVAQAVPDAAGLRSLVAVLDSPRWPEVDGAATFSCPMDDGSQDVVRVAYPSGPGAQVVVDLTGCRFAGNGVRTVQGDGIARYLTRWVGSPTAPA